ncbi:MAG: AMP-binding protein, partial [Candidatus Sericytochromatia bacterium]|nr:AMP-binding protein [Candidatus Tanganyikabacteria bacterium]
MPAIVLPGDVEPEILPWRDVAAQAGQAAFALLAVGLEPLEAVAFQVCNPERALAAAFGTWLAGGIVTFLDPAAEPELLAEQAAHAECRFVFRDPDIAAGRLAAQDGSPGPDPDLEILPLPGPAPADRLAWEAFLSSGREGLEDAWDLASRRISDLTQESVAAYAYRPKRVLLAAKLSHGGVLAAGAGLANALRLAEGDRIATRLPCHDPSGLAILVAAATANAALCADESWLDTRPTVLATPYPDIEGFAREILRSGEQGNPIQQRAWHWALETATSEFRRQQAETGSHASWKARLAERIGLESALEPHGGALRLLICTGGTPSRLAQELFGALGVRLATLYALPEASGPVAVCDARQRIPAGRIGIPVEGTEVELADDGQLLVHGRTLFSGYLKEPGATRNALLGGWFRTGDRAIRERGELRLVGPAGDERGLMEYVAPFDVEMALRDHAAVGDAFAVPGTPWTALLVPADDLLADIARRTDISIDEALTDPRVDQALQRALAAHNAT